MVKDLFWKAVNNKENWRWGRVLAEDGQLLLLVRTYGRLQRVTEDMAVMRGRDQASVGEQTISQKYSYDEGEDYESIPLQETRRAGDQRSDSSQAASIPTSTSRAS